MCGFRPSSGGSREEEGSTLGHAIRHTKIVCTLGPASTNEDVLRRLIDAGLDVARLNFSHGTHRDHSAALALVRRTAREAGRAVAVLQDLSGPKIRVTRLEGGGPVELRAGARVAICPGLEVGTAERLGCTYERLAKDVKKGERVLLDDGSFELVARSVARNELVCEVVHGGMLKERKGLNLPDSKLRVPALTEKDKEDLLWGLAHGVDYVALSFVRSPDDIADVRRAAEAKGKEVRVIAKIEKPEAVRRLDAIVEAADGVMVARGDLGVEMPVHQVPAVQKRIIRECILRDKPVITATQMLESMTQSPVPTRAEVSDVANAIYDGTDAVMLSAETASGKYPVHAVRTMSRVALETEAQMRAEPSRHFLSRMDESSFADAVCGGAHRIAEDIRAKVLVVFSASGKTALFMSKYFPRVPIVAVSFDEAIARTMVLFRGVHPFRMARPSSVAVLVERTEAELLERGFARKGDVAVMVGGATLGIDASTNTVMVRRIGG